MFSLFYSRNFTGTSKYQGMFRWRLLQKFYSAVPAAVFRNSYSSTAFDEHLHDTCIVNLGDAKVEALPAGHALLDPAVVI